jgi:hypothetical protein
VDHHLGHGGAVRRVDGVGSLPTCVNTVTSRCDLYDLVTYVFPTKICQTQLALLATFGNLRWGELAGLRRRNLDPDDRCVRVSETVYEFGQLVKGTPKSRVSIRTVVLPRTDRPRAATAPGHVRGCRAGRLCLCRC